MSLSKDPLSLSPHIKLQRASATIDEITKALSEFSRSTAPEPLHVPVCSCCDADNCETKLAWGRDRVELVDRLVLSAGKVAGSFPRILSWVSVCRTFSVDAVVYDFGRDWASATGAPRGVCAYTVSSAISF